MSTPMLSILIPARNEEWLARTVQDLLENIEDDTEIIVGLDGYWPEPGIVDDNRVKIFHSPEPIGQRAMQNKLARLSTAKYVMKVDAHCAFDKGFDRKMLEKMEDDITMVPVMRNLHVFNWRCLNCGMETYQGPQPDQCRNEECANIDQRFEKNVVWIPKSNPQSSAYRFNKNLQFKYFPELRARQARSGLQETMSLQGSCFMCTREKYWELGLCDESWGSWGQQGTEVAVKTWLSGGRVLCNMDTWYAHLFRTQHGFSFPYPMSGRSQQKAREISQDLFLNDKWDKATRPLSWLLEKFWPALSEVQDFEARWTIQDIKKQKGEPSRAMLYYTHNQLKLKIAHRVQNQLLKISSELGIPIVSVSMKPIPKMGKNIVFKGERGYLSMFKQILTAIENTDADILYFTEHDVLYHPSHFMLTPPDKNNFYYNQNWWRVRSGSDIAVHWDANQVSGLICYRDLALEWYRNKIKEIEEKGFDRSYEPDGRNINTLNSEFPNIDIRGEWNQTKSKWSPDDFRDKSTCINWQETTIDQISGWEDLDI